MYLPWVVAEARSVTLALATTRLGYLKVSDVEILLPTMAVSVDPDA